MKSFKSISLQGASLFKKQVRHHSGCSHHLSNSSKPINMTHLGSVMANQVVGSSNYTFMPQKASLAEVVMNRHLERGLSSTTPKQTPQTWGRSLTIQNLMDNNLRWAREMTDRMPGFFDELSKQQAPEYLWIGCSDSRVPSNEIIRLRPGEVFTHRNIANVVNHTDFSCLSVVQYAVEVLKVKHIIVCGHYRCGGVLAAMGHAQLGLIDNWLRPIKDLYARNLPYLTALDPDGRADLLCELNVARSVDNVCHTASVMNAWESGRELMVHGWCYRIDDGLIRDLYCSRDGPEDLLDDVYKTKKDKKH